MKTPLRTYTRFLLMAMLLLAALTGFCRAGHAVSSGDLPHQSERYLHDAPAGDPYCPVHDHSTDGCDTCVGCPCHAPLSLQQFQLKYSPIILSMGTLEQFSSLPEVYLSKFIPPQNHA